VLILADVEALARWDAVELQAFLTGLRLATPALTIDWVRPAGARLRSQRFSANDLVSVTE